MEAAAASLVIIRSFKLTREELGDPLGFCDLPHLTQSRQPVISRHNYILPPVRFDLANQFDKSDMDVKLTRNWRYTCIGHQNEVGQCVGQGSYS